MMFSMEEAHLKCSNDSSVENMCQTKVLDEHQALIRVIREDITSFEPYNIDTYGQESPGWISLFKLVNFFVENIQKQQFFGQ